MTTQLKDIDPGKGDDFAANVNSNTGQPRRFFTVIGDLDTTAQRIWSSRSIRPATVATDGLGNYKGTMTNGGALAPGSTFASAFSSASRALDLDPSAAIPPQCSGGLQATNAGDCAQRLIQWEVGEPMPSGVASREGNVLGSIYHSTPVVVGPPNDYIPDESYRAFAETPAQKTRPLVLYTATTDGQLHAFQVTAATASDGLKVDKVENNELWSFTCRPRAPRLLATFNQQSLLLDGALS